MDKSFVFNKNTRIITGIVLVIFVAIVMGMEIFANAVMTGGYKVQVGNVWIKNKNGLMVRGKLYRPNDATAEKPAPGVLYLHGYQNNRETSDPYGIELSRRGFVVILLDTLGRGNSDNQFSKDEPGFDPTYGSDSAFAYLSSLPFVDSERCGLGSHSLGGEMTYPAAMSNPNIKAVVFSGFAYRDDVTTEKPKNMLMIFGKYDEYRKRMTGVNDFETEWMKSPRTLSAFGVENPQFDKTYGIFKDGTARRVHMTRTTHVGESFDEGAIAEAVTWFSEALNPGVKPAIPAASQIWRYKEIASLIAMLFGIFCTIPAAILLLGMKPFSELAASPSAGYSCDKKTFTSVFFINAGLIQLYLPLIMVIFGIHVYLLHIEKIFPMVMINGVVFWFVIVNIIGFFIFRRWMKKEHVSRIEVNYLELGISEEKDSIKFNRTKLWKTFLLAVLLFIFVYVLQAVLEVFLLIDYRYKFPYASDMTLYRFKMFLIYFPFFLTGFFQVNIMLQGQLRHESGKAWFNTALRKSLTGIMVMVIPMLFHMGLQYLPLFINGMVPFVGPGGSFVGFIIGLEHMIVLQIMMVPIGSFLYEATGKIYAGTFLNALLVTWMFVSSSVIAPIPGL